MVGESPRALRRGQPLGLVGNVPVRPKGCTRPPTEGLLKVTVGGQPVPTLALHLEERPKTSAERSEEEVLTRGKPACLSPR